MWRRRGRLRGRCSRSGGGRRRLRWFGLRPCAGRRAGRGGGAAGGRRGWRGRVASPLKVQQRRVERVSARIGTLKERARMKNLVIVGLLGGIALMSELGYSQTAPAAGEPGSPA